MLLQSIQTLSLIHISNLRIELAQYKDMESFAQFSSDLDAETRRQLDHGKALMEMLKQPLYIYKQIFGNNYRDLSGTDRRNTGNISRFSDTFRGNIDH